MLDGLDLVVKHWYIFARFHDHWAIILAAVHILRFVNAAEAALSKNSIDPVLLQKQCTLKLFDFSNLILVAHI